ncbi:hypothetical protein [Nocardioides sp.]|uniref:hypothetical protein n=1 Tax=Nocardioides sp. TaxID=35761 RepID=UPI003783BDEC
MEVSIRPLVAAGAPAGTLRVWVGVLGHGDLPDLTWTVDGVAVTPTPVLPLRPAYPAAASLRVASGVVDLTGLPAGPHEVRVTASAPHVPPVGSTLTMRAVPTEVPRDGSSFNVLLVSCFYRGGDKAGRAGAVASALTGLDRPDVVLTVGDQVYLDQPPLIGTFDDERLAATFAQKYRDNFVGTTGYAALLRTAPVAGIPDDHEYWNNYPHPSPMTLQTLVHRGDLDHNPWRRAARAMYDAFQLAAPDTYTYRFDVPPLSFFMMDNRTFRDPDAKHTMRPGDLDLYRAWVAEAIADRLVPVLVTGPSLVQPGKGWWGRLLDRNFADYGDYRDIVGGLSELARHGRGALALTGDVHYGRVADVRLLGTAPDAGTPIGWVREVISSPSALVWGSDHQRPAAPRTEPGLGLTTEAVWPGGEDVRGDHVALLKFTRSAGGVAVEIQYRMVREVRGPGRGTYRLPPVLLPA